jgi:ABC-type nitrate/sulfonate/bicarbonate transport system substrate-binding protein
MQRFIRHALLLFSCLLFVALPLASCGGGGSGGSSTANTAGSMTLKVGYVTDAIVFLPFLVALDKGFFKEQGLALDPATPPQLGSGSKLATAVEANSIEVGVGALTDAFTMSRVDAHIKVAAAITNDFLLDVVVSKKFEEETHLNARSSLSEKVQALKGRKVGISSPGSATDALVTYLFRQEGLDAQKDVVKVNLGANTATDLAAVQAGRVDAVVVGAPGGEIAEIKKFGDIFISPVRGDVPTMQGQLFSVAYLKQETIDAKPNAVRAFIRGLAQADAFIQKNPGQMPALMAKYLQLDQQTATTAWAATKPSMPPTPVVTQQSYDTANQFHVKAGLIALALDYKELVAADTMNNAVNGTGGS